ncbi:MAG: alanine/glycine:cation symporter family protein [Oscillospiraceae bacterium]
MGIIEKLNSIVWGAPTLILMLASGAVFSIGTGFFQLRHFGHWMKCTVFSRSSKNSDSSSVTAFQAMSSALAATLGTGNIAGVSTALTVGGAGAVFWMWISAIFGTMTGFAENVLGTYFRRKSADGEWLGGAMYYIRDGLGSTFAEKQAKPLAALYAILCVLTAFGMGNMAQVNAAADALRTNFAIPAAATGVCLAAAEIFMIFGGVKRIGSITAKLVPFMSCFYILGAVWILADNAERISSIFGFIFNSAFGFSAVGGGISGYVVKQAVSTGFRRGVFSNEAGLGTSVSAHAASEVREPCIQGMWSIFEVFFDTIVMCSLTAAILLASPCKAPCAQQAFSNISTQTQYFRLTDSDRLITDSTASIVCADGEEYRFTTIYSTGFTCNITKGDETFCNLMTVRGIQTTDEHGQPVFLDRDRKVPLIEEVLIEPVSGTQLVTYAFSGTFGKISGKLLAAAMLMFAFSTVIGWSCFGTRAAVYLMGKQAEKPFKCIFVAVTAVSTMLDFSAVWGISDLVNGMMALPNLLTLFILSPTVFKITDNYCRRTFRKEKIPPLLSYHETQKRYSRYI